MHEGRRQYQFQANGVLLKSGIGENVAVMRKLKSSHDNSDDKKQDNQRVG